MEAYAIVDLATSAQHLIVLRRIEALKRVVLDERQPDAKRVEAADELFMWGGALATRFAVSRNLFHVAGCVRLKDGGCQCDGWKSLVTLLPATDRARVGLLLPSELCDIFEEELSWRQIRRSNEPTSNPGDGWFWLRRARACDGCGEAMPKDALARYDSDGELVCEGCGA